MNFTEQQLKVIEKLEKTFKEAKKAGLYFIGIGDCIRVSNISFRFFNPEHEMSEMVNNGDFLETYDTYQDSCGD